MSLGFLFYSFLYNSKSPLSFNFRVAQPWFKVIQS